jgi:maltose/moltooligosaccharide transporter
MLVGLGGLFAGVTGPLLSNFVPPLVRDVLGDERFLIGSVMAIDNVLLLLLVPWAGAMSDRARALGKGRLPLVLAGLVMAAVAMAAFPWSGGAGIVGIIAAMVVLYSGVNLQRAPVQALIVDLVPSRLRSLATGSVTFQMCLGAIVFLMLGRMLGMRVAFLIAGGTSLLIALAFALLVREPRTAAGPAAETTFGSIADAVGLILRGAVPGLRAVFFATLLLQMIFQTFTTWYALHATERFNIPPEDVSIGFIAWAVGGVIGALPAGMIGVRIGRRNAMLLGFFVMTVCLVLLNQTSTLGQATPLLALASAGWTLPQVNAYPLFVEPLPAEKRGVFAGMFLLCMALGGALGDPLNGSVFDLAGGYHPMFLMMAAYTVLAAVTIFLVPRGSGEAQPDPVAIN